MTMKLILTHPLEVVMAVVPRLAEEATEEEEAALPTRPEAVIVTVVREMMHPIEEATEKRSLRKLSRRARKKTESMSETYLSRSDGMT